MCSHSGIAHVTRINLFSHLRTALFPRLLSISSSRSFVSVYFRQPFPTRTHIVDILFAGEGQIGPFSVKFLENSFKFSGTGPPTPIKVILSSPCRLSYEKLNALVLRFCFLNSLCYVLFCRTHHFVCACFSGQKALFLWVFYRFFALLEINFSLCQTNGVSYFIGC